MDSDKGTEAAIALRLRLIEQSQRRISTNPSGKVSYSSTTPQRHCAICFDSIIRPSTSFIFFDESDESVRMNARGHIYVPKHCIEGESCRLHLALHGCQQHQELIGEDFYTRSGYNEWAETNNVIVLYPQTTEWIGSIFTAAWRNPNACWDWWGYSGPRYYRKDGKQIRALAEMINTLVGRELLGDTSAP